MSLASQHSGLGYQSTSSREPIWTRVSDDPSENHSHHDSRDNAHLESSVSSLNSEINHGKGLSVFSAAIFVAGEMAGSGILAIPKAVVDCGWVGLVLVIVFCLNAAFGGTRLANCWAILEERYPEYRGSSRNPYSTIAYRAVGKWGSVLVSACIQFTLFGASIVYLLLAAEIVQDLLRDVITGYGYCSWFLFFAILVTPPMWLGTPKDFGFAGIGALLTTAISCVLIFAQIVMDGLHRGEFPAHKSHSSMEFFLAFGVILFAYGGASTFPTIQNDMHEREKFSKSVLIGFAVILLLYIPVTFGGYLVYGDHINANILLSLRRGVFVSTANIFMAIHLLLAFFIIINPVCQEIEELLNVPHEFCVKRCIVRTLMVGLMVIVGETIPKFGMILALVGGSTITLTTFVLPNYFYMRLCDQTSTEWPERCIPPHVRVYMWELILVGLMAGTAATYNAVIAIIGPNSLTKPCYWPN